MGADIFWKEINEIRERNKCWKRRDIVREKNLLEATEMGFLFSFFECYAMFEAESSNLI